MRSDQIREVLPSDHISLKRIAVEIAAQLAELNENLKGIARMRGPEVYSAREVYPSGRPPKT